MSDILRRPEEWAYLVGFTIHDPDGWRGSGGRPFADPITAKEFDERAWSCTISGNFGLAADLPEFLRVDS